MQDPEGIRFIRKIREELLGEMRSMTREEWEKLVRERAQSVEKRIAEQRNKQERLVASGNHH